VADDLGEAHVGDILGADDAFEACVGHCDSAKTGETGLGHPRTQIGDDARSIVVARGFTGGEKDARIGVGSDGDKFRSFRRLADLESRQARQLSSGRLLAD
jgi:hypothetical protein